jgi:uncharacterized protein
VTGPIRSLFLIGAALIALAAQTAAQSNSPPSAELARAIAACDAQAAHPLDPDRPQGVQGVIFENIDTARALETCRTAAGLDGAPARIHMQLGRALAASDDLAAARAAYRIAAERGSRVAMVNLAQYFMSGIGGDGDPAAGIAWLRRAAELDLPLAMVTLGNLHETGEHVAQDDLEAVRWYRRAAEFDDPAGQNALASMFEDGRGVDRNEVEAERYWRAAAAQDFPDALNNLAWFLAQRGRNIDEARRFAERAFELVPDNPDIADTLALVLLRQGWPARALEFAEFAVSQRPDEPNFLERAGDALLALERADAARDYWRRALERAQDARQRERLAAKLARP